MVTGVTTADTIASVLIALLILPRTWGLLRDAVDVLLEATPKGFDMGLVRAHILEAPGATESGYCDRRNASMPMPTVTVEDPSKGMRLAERCGIRSASVGASIRFIIARRRGPVLEE